MTVRQVALVSIMAVALIGVVWIMEFVNGFNFAREPWFILAPIELLMLPAVALLGLATVAILFARRPVDQRTSWGWIAWLCVGLGWLGTITPYASSVSPRLYGMAVRARSEDARIVAIAGALRRNDSHAAVALGISDLHRPFMFPMRMRTSVSNDQVEIWWGSGLTGSWGIRVSDHAVDTPRLVEGSDSVAMLASDRVTVFIRSW